jgi:hypothetical protein
MTSVLLALAFVLLILVLALLAYIMATERTFNLHRVWDLALEGHRLARWYICLVALAFFTAVAAWVSAFMDHPSAKAATGIANVGQSVVATAALRSNRSFDTDAQRRSSASLRPSPPVAGQLQR